MNGKDLSVLPVLWFFSFLLVVGRMMFQFPRANLKKTGVAQTPIFSDDQQMHLPQQPPNSNFVQTHNELSSQKE